MSSKEYKNDDGYSSDSDDSTNDELVRMHAGRPSFRKSASVSQPLLSQEASVVTADESPNKLASLTEEEIETKARKELEGTQPWIVQNINDLKQIGWRRKKQKKGNVFSFYPCIIVPDDEARLCHKNLKDSQIVVRYVGRCWDDKLKRETIIRSTFHPSQRAKREGMNKDEVRELNLSGKDDDACLQSFLDEIFPTKEEVVKRKVEELFVRSCFEKVAENQMLTGQEQKKEEEKLAEMNAQTAQSPAVKPRSTNTDGVGENNADADENDDVLFSPDAKRLRIELRPGDVIEYYPPERVSGAKYCLKRSRIIGVDPKKQNPLNLECGDFLPKDCKVRRVEKNFRGKLVPDEKSVWRLIGDYSLRTAGISKLVGLENQVKSIQGIRSSFMESADKFWQDRADATEADNLEASQMSKKRQRPVEKALVLPSTKDPSDDIECLSNGHPWEQILSKKIAEEEDNIKERRRYVPHLSPQDLQLVMDVWRCLQNKSQDPTKSLRIQGAVDMLSNELELSTMQLDAILRGDPKLFLSMQKKNIALAALQDWIKEQQN